MITVIVGITCIVIGFIFGWLAKIVHYKSEEDRLNRRMEQELGKDFKAIAEEIEWKSKPWNNGSQDETTHPNFWQKQNQNARQTNDPKKWN